MTKINQISTSIPNCFKNIAYNTFIPSFSKDAMPKNGTHSFDKQNTQYIDVFSPEYQENLYKNKRFAALAAVGAKELFCDYPATYNIIKDNKDFQELVNSDCFNTKEGFFDLLRIVNTLRRERADKIAHPEYRLPAPPNYAKYDIPDYLRFLNNFAKSNISLDLKKYYIKENGKKIISYYKTLNKITPETDVLALLLAPPRYVY